MEYEIYLALPLTREEACLLYLTILEKGKMLATQAKQSPDPINELTMIALANSIEEKLAPHIPLLGRESDGNRPRGPKRAPAGKEWR